MADKLDLLMTLTLVAEGMDRIEALERQFEELRQFVQVPLTTSIQLEAKNVSRVQSALKTIAASGLYPQRALDTATRAAEAAAARVARSLGLVGRTGEGIARIEAEVFNIITGLMDDVASATADATAKTEILRRSVASLEQDLSRISESKQHFDAIRSGIEELQTVFSGVKLDMGQIVGDRGLNRRWNLMMADMADALNSLGIHEGPVRDSFEQIFATSDPTKRAARVEEFLQRFGEVVRNTSNSEHKVLEELENKKRLLAEAEKEASQQISRSNQQVNVVFEEQQKVIADLRKELELLRKDYEQLTASGSKATQRKTATDGGVNVAQVAEEVVQKVTTPQTAIKFKVDTNFLIAQITQAIKTISENNILQLRVKLEPFDETPPEVQGLEAARQLLTEFRGLNQKAIAELPDGAEKLTRFSQLVQAVAEAAKHLPQDVQQELKLDSLEKTRRKDDTYISTDARIRDTRLEKYAAYAEETLAQRDEALKKKLAPPVDLSQWQALDALITKIAEPGRLEQGFTFGQITTFNVTLKNTADQFERLYTVLERAPEHFRTLDVSLASPVERLHQLDNLLSAIQEHAQRLGTSVQERVNITADSLNAALTAANHPKKGFGPKKETIESLSNVYNTLGNRLERVRNLLKEIPDLYEQLQGPTERATLAFTTQRTIIEELRDIIRGLNSVIRSLGKNLENAQGPLETLMSAIERLAGPNMNDTLAGGLSAAQELMKEFSSFTPSLAAISPGEEDRLKRFYDLIGKVKEAGKELHPIVQEILQLESVDHISRDALQRLHERTGDLGDQGFINALAMRDTPFKERGERLQKFAEYIQGTYGNRPNPLHTALGMLSGLGRNAAALDTYHKEFVKLTTSTKEYIKSVTEQTHETETSNKTASEQITIIEQLQKENEKLTKEVEKLTKAKKKSNEEDDKANKKRSIWEDFRRRFRTLGVFAPTATIVFSTTMAIRRALQDAIQLEQIFADIQAVLPARNISDRFRIQDAVINNAFRYAVAINEVAEASKFFAQAGYTSPKVIGEAVQVALMGVRGAGLTSQQAQELVLALRAITQGAIDAQDVLERVSRIEARRAVTAQDLFQVITRVGPIAEQLKGEAVGILDGFDVIMGATTGIIERTRITGSQAATSLRFIIARLGAPDVIRNLQRIGGVRLAADEAGQTLRPLREILQDVAIAYERLVKAGKTGDATQLLVQLGGARQLSATTALIQSFLRDGLQTAREGALAFGDLAERTNTSMKTMQTALTQTRVGLTNFAKAFIQFPVLSHILRFAFSSIGAFTTGLGKSLDDLNKSLVHLFTNPFAVRMLTPEELSKAPRLKEFEKLATEMKMYSWDIMEAVRAPTQDIAQAVADEYRRVERTVGAEVRKFVVHVRDLTEEEFSRAELVDLGDILAKFDVGELEDETLRERILTQLADRYAEVIPLFADYKRKLEEATKEDEKATIQKQRHAKAVELLRGVTYVTNAVLAGNVERVRAQTETISAELDALFDPDRMLRGRDLLEGPIAKWQSGGIYMSLGELFNVSQFDADLASFEKQAARFIETAGRMRPIFETLFKGDLFTEATQEVLGWQDSRLKTFGNVLGVLSDRIDQLADNDRVKLLDDLGNALARVLNLDKIPSGQFPMGLDPQERLRENIQKLMREALEREITKRSVVDEEARRYRELLELLGSSGATRAFELQQQRDEFTKATDPFVKLIREFVKGERVVTQFAGVLPRLGIEFDALDARLENTTNFLRSLLSFTAETEDHLLELQARIRHISQRKFDLGEVLTKGSTKTFEDYVNQGKQAVNSLADQFSLVQSKIPKDEDLADTLFGMDEKRRSAILRLQDEIQVYKDSLEKVVGKDGLNILDVFGVTDESLRLVADFRKALQDLDTVTTGEGLQTVYAQIQKVIDATANRVRQLQAEKTALQDRLNLITQEEQLLRLRSDAERVSRSLYATPEEDLRRQHTLEMQLLDLRLRRAEELRYKNELQYQEELKAIQRARDLENERLRLMLEAHKTNRALIASHERNVIQLDRQVALLRLNADVARQTIAYRDRISERTEIQLELEKQLYEIERQRILNDPKLRGDDNAEALRTALIRLNTEHQSTQLATRRLAVAEAEARIVEATQQNMIQALDGFKRLFTDPSSLRGASGRELFANFFGPLAQNVLGNTFDDLVAEVFDPRASGFFGNLTRTFGGYTADKAKRDALRTAELAGRTQAEEFRDALITAIPELGWRLGIATRDAIATGSKGVITGGVQSVRTTRTPSQPSSGDSSDSSENRQLVDVLRSLKDQIALLGASTAATYLAGGGSGAQTGSTIGAMAGQSLGKALVTQGMSAALSAALPVAGTVIGAVAGSFLGGLFDKEDKNQQKQLQTLERIDESTRQSATVLEIQRQLMETARGAVNVPSSFILPQYTPQQGSVVQISNITFAPQFHTDGNVDADELANAVYSRFSDFLTDELGAMGVRLPST